MIIQNNGTKLQNFHCFQMHEDKYNNDVHTNILVIFSKAKHSAQLYQIVKNPEV